MQQPNSEPSVKSDADVLDFNESHKSNPANMGARFSITRIKHALVVDDMQSWLDCIDNPATTNFEYPASLHKAQVHQQSCYYQANHQFILNNKENQCTCCGNIIRQKKYSIFTSNMYDIMAADYGIAVPLYFTMIKLHTIMLTLLGVLFGAYYIYLSHRLCTNNTTQSSAEVCKFIKSSFVTSPRDIMKHLQTTGHLDVFLIIAYIAYFIVMCTPFIHEIVIRSRQVKYWRFELLNHIQYPKLTLYIKHLPKKFNEQELLIYIHNALQQENCNISTNNIIEELVYIYDTHIIKQINQDRIVVYRQFLQTTQALKLDPNNIQLKEQFIDQIVSLMHQTREIGHYMKIGLPFTNKVLIKFKSRTVTEQVYYHYQKPFFKKIISIWRTMWGQAKDYERQKTMRLELQQATISESPSKCQSAMKNESETPSDLQIYRSKSFEDFGNQQRSKYQLSRSMADMLNFNDQVDTIIEPQLNEEKKELHIQRGFRQDDIYWDNIGMHTLKRLILRIITTTITITVGALCMYLFELLFIIQQSIKNEQTNLELSIVANMLTLVIIFLAVFASVLVIAMTTRSKRSTYSLQEKNMITFMGPIQQLCIISFPYILALSVYDGFKNVTPLYTLFMLARIRIIFKGIIHVFHLRSVGFYCRRRKILKNFNGNNYFQRELNEQMTPSLFPIRSRILYAFFIFSTGLLMMFIGPFILVICIPFQIFFYFFDKYCILNVYRVDKQFTFELLKYLVWTYQIIMIPIYGYVYICLFGNSEAITIIGSEWCLIAGYSTAGVSFLGYSLFRRSIADFWVFRVFRYQKQIKNSDYFMEKSYFQSYSEYFDKLGIEELNQILIKQFKNMQYNSSES